MFELLSEDNRARRGILKTRHGDINTPAFMPVGTAATVKGVFTKDLISSGSEIILGNTYHLMLRPGSKLIRNMGGLHKFMNWKKPILTDSGGYQVFSLSKLRKIEENGVTFSSHIDGEKILLTPERSMEIQSDLNSDIVMAFDECTPYPCSYETAKVSMELSMRWAKRCKTAFSDNPNLLFGIVQGGLFDDLRLKSLKELIKIGFDGYAIGGLAVGDSQKEMFKVLDYLKNYMPINKPRYLMGVGTPSDILGSVMRGVDMFDCVLPTRAGRTGLAFTWNGRVNIRNAKYKKDNKPLDESVKIFDLNKYSKNYINHLFNTNEMLGSMILTLNNINFYQELMFEIRKNIKKGTFSKFYNKYSRKL